jgi:hypothetical protein
MPSAETKNKKPILSDGLLFWAEDEGFEFAEFIPLVAISDM